MKRILLLAATTGYQTRAFGEAAERLGVDLVFATDRCHLLDDPWQDHAIPIRFHDETASIAAILAAARQRPIDGVLVVGDRPTVIGARVAEALGLPGHAPDAVAIARHKQRSRERLRDAGLPVPWFIPFAINPDDSAPVPEASWIGIRPPTYPCVVKPVALSGSRGVMRADDSGELRVAIERLHALVRSPEIRAERDASMGTALVEEFLPGGEYAVEGLMHRGAFQPLAIFDKPDPLDGPFFEETIYVTPSSATASVRAAIVDAVSRATAALGLSQGPIHAECRVAPPTADQPPRVFILEVAARPIGGLCARALLFRRTDGRGLGLGIRDSEYQLALNGQQSAISLEELLLRHALGEDTTCYEREAAASGVMMIPIPRRGVYRGVGGVEAARRVPYIEDVRITAKADQLLVPLPEGASYLGFIFARAAGATLVDVALRTAHQALSFQIDAEFPVLRAGQIHYNHGHG
jgi:hypothetical protein